MNRIEIGKAYSIVKIGSESKRLPFFDLKCLVCDNSITKIIANSDDRSKTKISFKRICGKCRNKGELLHKEYKRRRHNQYYKQNNELCKNIRRNYLKICIEQRKDYYIRRLLNCSFDTKYVAEMYNSEIIEIKRLQLLLKREVWKQR